ncbi:imidazolonepropionase [Glycomyces xiaoerkulensis]|uniref:imidazolonepropionase n=1 Tax=Glycomyces xiaoerkulensis TaxID=2038139 RepID=UPI000C25652E|nr:imidazolonepropionase [Glycomyces xiaoerkulensis]
MSLLIDNIGELFTAGDDHRILHDAALVTSGDTIGWVGPRTAAPAADRRLDAEGGAVLPGLVDSHAHLVFAGDRAEEFASRMAGRPYTGGGIRTTVAATRAADEETLHRTAARLAAEMRRQGTTTVEIKSGYGLAIADEIRQLRVAAAFTDETTFLGAHTVPLGWDADDYVRLVTGPMLAEAAPHSKWIDVFCERGAFDGDQARAVLTAGRQAGLGLRIHAGQLTRGPGVRLAVELGAASADHCTHLSEADIDALADGGTVATLLPGADFSTDSAYPDARKLIDAGATVALATDCNPGSSYTSSMPFCIALAVRETGMTPTEAVTAATAGGAKALRRDDIGRIETGARADLVVLDAPTHLHLAYRPGVPLVSTVVQAGTVLTRERP